MFKMEDMFDDFYKEQKRIYKLEESSKNQRFKFKK